ncbi:LOB domain-containing protein 40-like [Rhodamnia argentea]|uniref:LOB domain-containing protein 40-like n=1 Tax=Rhodamnia argentea TaxID=178133 RepID=A0A8B8P5J0_9MYRT|nr:LOB domain-containing protein 40-like [Rhodamnia argentea]
MRMSCNGCRVLRKGCGDNCSIRPCLQWIKSPASQAHATVFLAKFYGRAGLMNLINAGPEPLRPAIFRSLLYEACGRILNPIYGSVGLLWDGSWQLCHAATEAVLSGMPITPIASASEAVAPPLKAYDIRHVPREENPAAAAMMATAAGEVNGARPNRSGRFKRPGARTKAHQHPPPTATVECCNVESNKSLSHESSLSHQSELGTENAEGGGDDSKETESNSMVSAETTTTVAKPSQPVKAEPVPESEVGLELTLGAKPVSRESRVIPVKKRRFEQRDGACRMELGL